MIPDFDEPRTPMPRPRRQHFRGENLAGLLILAALTWLALEIL